MKRTGFVVVFAAAAAIFGVQSQASATTMLTATTAASCPPGGCVSESGLLSRTFSSDRFAGPVDIGSFNFDRTMLKGLGGTQFKLSFWTADGQAKIGDFGNFDVSVLGGDILTLAGRAFTYDPSMGDLVMRIQVARPVTGGAGGLGGFGGAGGGLASLALAGSSTVAEMPRMELPMPPIDATPLLAIVPEPTIWAQLILGFAATGALLRRRRPRLVA